MTLEIQDTCGQCKYFATESQNENIGRCRRFPRDRALQHQLEQHPITKQIGLTASENCNYPLQHPADWCGEFVKAKIPIAMGNA